MKLEFQAKMVTSSLVLAAVLLSWETVNGHCVPYVQPQLCDPLNSLSVVEGRLVIPAIIRPMVLDAACSPPAPPPSAPPAPAPCSAGDDDDDDDPSLKSLLYCLLFANAKNRGAPAYGPPCGGYACPCGCGGRGSAWAGGNEYNQGYAHNGCGCPYDRSPKGNGRNTGGNERPSKGGKGASKPAKGKSSRQASGSCEDESHEECDRNGISLCISTDC